MHMCRAARFRRGFFAIILGVSLLSSSCAQPPPPHDAQPSAEALIGEVLQALARRDRTRLESLAISATEFRDHVWEFLPAARPERNLPMSYVWGDLHQKSIGNLSRILGQLGGQRMELVAVSFGTPPRSYGPFVIHGDPRVRVRMAGGEERDVTVCGSLFEPRGQWKVFSFVADD